MACRLQAELLTKQITCFATLALEFRSRNAWDEINRAHGLKKLRFAPRCRGFVANCQVPEK